MRITNSNNRHLNIHDAHSQKAARDATVRKGSTNRHENTARKTDSEIGQLVKQLRNVTDDRSDLIEAVKQRLAAGEYDSPTAMEATAKAIFNNRVM